MNYKRNFDDFFTVIKSIAFNKNCKASNLFEKTFLLSKILKT